MRKWSVWALGVVLAFTCLTASTRAEDDDVDAKAKKVHKTYLLERRDKTWGSFLRRLSALRELGPLRCDRARKALLKIARTGKTLDDRLLAAQGLATYGDLASVKELLTMLAGKGHPVLTEIVGQGLAATKDGSVLAWLPEEAFELPEAALAPVLRAHARLGMPEAASALVWRVPPWSSKEATIGLAFDAIQALGRSKFEQGQPSVFEAAQHPDHRIRLAAADVVAIRNPDGEKTAVAVRALLQDDEGVVKRAMAEGIAAAKAETFVPDVTHLLGDEDPRTRKTAHEVLKRLTKQDLGFDGGAWRRWWEKRGTPEAPKPHTVPSYHGLPIFTEHVAFIIDRSGSMRWPHRTGYTTRMEVARDALVTVLGEISPRTQFNLTAFDKKVDPWKKTEMKAEPKTIAKAVRWVKKQESERGAGTNTYGVLKKTYENNPTIDTIYFLSDGIPEDGEITTSEGLLAAVGDWNRYRRVRIHVIALTLQNLDLGRLPITSSVRRAGAFMKQLAAAGDGRFQLIIRP